MAVRESRRRGWTGAAALVAVFAGWPVAPPAASGTEWRARAAAAIDAEEYHFTWLPGGVLQAPNRAQGIRARIRGEGFEVVDRETGGERFLVGLSAARLGRGETSSPLAARGVRGLAERAEIDRGPVQEWLVNGRRGLKHGFTIHERPEGEASLWIELRLTGAAAHARGPEAVAFDGPGGKAALHYAELAVFDAGQIQLPARFEFAPSALRIVIDDAGATYPVTVDPLFWSSWSAEGGAPFASFGLSVSTAGDVNGDGYSDIVVGAPGYDGGQFEEGAAFVFLGGASGLPATPAFALEIDVASAGYGEVVATAGDVDGDGDDEVLVAAPDFDGGTPFVNDTGRVDLWEGDPEGLAAAPAWTVVGGQSGSLFGTAVGFAGFLDGDAYADVLIAAPSWDGTSANTGRVFVYYGSATGLPATAGTLLNGTASSSFGRSAAAAGDVNGDGFGDVVVGSPFWNGDLVDEGRAQAFFGSSGGLSATAAWTVEGDAATSQFGFSIAGAGDLDGDGYADVVVGSPGYDSSASLQDTGRLSFFFGSGTGLSTNALTAFWGLGSGARIGWSVAAAGDVNGDGVADVVAGAPNASVGETSEGAAIVCYGRQSGGGFFSSIFQADSAGAGYGLAVSTAGDVNGDGLAEVLIGAPYLASSTTGGSAFVYYGGGETMTSLAATYGGTSTNSDFGTSVATSCDVNGDGYGDLIIGDPLYSSSEINEGALFVHHGGPTGPASTPVIFQSNVPGIRTGFAVACAGDVDSDGYDDVIVSSPLYDNGQVDEGIVHLLRGSSGGLSAIAAWSAESNQANSGFGEALARAGDVNGDGYADVIIGAPRYDGGNADEGAAFVYLGQAGGLATTPSVVLQIDQTFAQFGHAVAWAGDYNADGFSDVAVGAPLWDHSGLNDAGVVHLFLGSAAGIAADSSYAALGGQAGAEFGRRVTYAGDFNGDGHSDLLIAAPKRDGGQVDEGRVWLYRGRSMAAPQITSSFESDIAGALFGDALASAGDVNGDGYSDVAIGEYLDAFDPTPRSVRVFLGNPAGLVGSPAITLTAAIAKTLWGRGLGSADINGDGFSDLLLGAPNAPDGEGGVNVGGRLGVYYGGAQHYGAGGTNVDFVPRTRRLDDTAPVALLGKSSSADDWRIRGTARSPAGRTPLSVVSEARDVREPFDATGAVAGSYSDSGPVGSTGSDLFFSRSVVNVTGGPLYKWRFRVHTRDPRFPRSRWVGEQGNGPHEADLRTSCVPATYYPDADGDGYGATAGAYPACNPKPGYVTAGGDCADDDATRFPGNPELCDAKDNDCNGAIDDGFSPPGPPVLSQAFRSASTVEFYWAAVPGADRYDVVFGDLADLRDSGGDFVAATDGCQENNGLDLTFKDSKPASKSGAWFLVRAIACTAPGSYDTGAASQVGSRDAAIAASPAPCP